MNSTRDLAFCVFLASLATMVVGLIVPWVTLWWMSIQNRKRVIQLYGSLALAAYVFYLIL